MFCKQCGKQLGDSDAYCTQCGTKVDVNKTAPVEQPIINNGTPQQTNRTVNMQQPTQQTVTNENVQQQNFQTVHQQPLNQQPINQQFYQNQPMQNPIAQSLGMNWYKFLIYFALFASAVLNFSASLMYFTGQIHNMSYETSVEPKTVYAFFPSLKGLDIFMGVICLCLVALAIITRIFLAKYKKSGPMFLYTLIGINIVSSVIYLISTVIIVGNVTGQATIDPTDITSIVVSIVMLVLNIIYFNKRKNMFVN